MSSGMRWARPSSTVLVAVACVGAEDGADVAVVAGEAWSPDASEGAAAAPDAPSMPVNLPAIADVVPGEAAAAAAVCCCGSAAGEREERERTASTKDRWAATVRYGHDPPMQDAA